MGYVYQLGYVLRSSWNSNIYNCKYIKNINHDKPNRGAKVLVLIPLTMVFVYKMVSTPMFRTDDTSFREVCPSASLIEDKAN